MPVAEGRNYRAPNPRGSDLTDADLDPRNSLHLGDYGAPTWRALTSKDFDVKAWQLWASEDVWYVPADGVFHGMNWWKDCRPDKLAAIGVDTTAALGFVAQTSTAASYGLFQMMYDTAMDE